MTRSVLTLLITRELMTTIECYFKQYPNYVKKRQKQSNNIHYKYNSDIESDTSDYDIKMYKIVEKTIKLYQYEKEKTFFIRKCMLPGKTWGEVLDDFNIERRTFFMWKREILSDAVVLALKEKLIDLNSKSVKVKKSKSAAPQV